MGRNYTPMTSLQQYKARGVASWYGRRYHGKQTSSGELYDMYGMSAAHPILPIPSYVRVTNVTNGKTVVVRVNDRGPFLYDRIIDLSYTAAYKLGVLSGGSAQVEVEAILPGTAPSVLASAPPAQKIPAPPAPAPIVAITAPVKDAGEVAQTVLAAPESRPAAAGSVFLQLGAFGSKENAESYLTRVKAQVDWLADRVQLVQRDGLFRVHAGPFAVESEARTAASRIRDTLGTAPVLVSR